jgi:4-amino-4-deoxy-L-arabinose transferase-like glycosyltransferase
VKTSRFKLALPQPWRDMLCLAAVFTLFYFIYLGSYPLFTPDEGRYTEVAREMLANHDFITPRVNGVPFLDKPALYYWLQAAALAMFGIKEWAIRFFPACFGIAGCLMTYATGRFLFNRRTGLLAAAMLATSPLYFASAHYANLDLEVAVLINAALFAFICAVKNPAQPNTRLLYAAYAFAGLAFLTKGMIGLVFPALIIGAWIAILPQWSLITRMRLFTGLSLSAAIILPWYLLAQAANPDFLHYFFVEQQVTRFLSQHQFNNPTPFWFYLPIVLIGLLPWACFLPQALAKHVRAIIHHKHAQAAPLFLLLSAAIIFVFFSIPHSKTVSYILPVFPALTLLIANYLDGIFDSATRHALPTILFTLISGLFGALLLLNYHFQWLALSSAMTPFLTILGALLIFGGVISLCLSHLRLPILFTYMCSWSALFLLTLMLSAGHLNDRTTKPLLPILEAQLQPNDVIVNYYTFYQDLPLYLNHTITLVADWQSPTIANKDNWVRELWVHMKNRKEDNLMTNDTFAARWRGPQRLFVFLDAKYLNQLEATVGDVHLINQYHNIVLVSNRDS